MSSAPETSTPPEAETPEVPELPPLRNTRPPAAESTAAGALHVAHFFALHDGPAVEITRAADVAGTSAADVDARHRAFALSLENAEAPSRAAADAADAAAAKRALLGARVHVIFLLWHRRPAAHSAGCMVPYGAHRVAVGLACKTSGD